MLTLTLLIAYLCGFSFILALIPVDWENRPSLKAMGLISDSKNKKSGIKELLRSLLRAISMINKPICKGALRVRIAKDIAIAHVQLTPEEFFVLKELGVILFFIIMFPMMAGDTFFFWVVMAFAAGYMIPEFWLKQKIKRVKYVITKELPDAIDLLGLCVNAGLDFMLSLKWVVEKSPPSVMVAELNILLQEINVGKTRREALKDLAARYELPDLSSFTRTLIQADKMGTSVTEALNILSEDMRQARYRRGEQLALKAPLKMLVPLLLFIFPVVGILVAGPIFLDFVENNPFKSMAGK